AAGAQASVHVTSPTTGVSCGALANLASATTTNDGAAHASATVAVDCPVGIDIVKSGPALAHVGDDVVYTLAVTTTTITPLTSVAVTDPRCDAAPFFVSGDDGDVLLEPLETWTYTCAHRVTTADADPMTNAATATGVGNDRIVQDSDDHVVDLIHPAIAIDKTASPISGSPGTPVVFTYVVTNTGDTTLFAIAVVDDKLGAVGTIAQLEPGQRATLTRGSVLGAAGVTNVGTAAGEDVLGKRVEDDDETTVTVVAGVRLPSTGAGAPWRLGLLFLAAGAALVVIARRRKEAGTMSP
ncbi:MAG: DUF7507 domain-containing protein, partial [Actinomycetota bacterium]